MKPDRNRLSFSDVTPCKDGNHKDENHKDENHKDENHKDGNHRDENLTRSGTARLAPSTSATGARA